jgi:hypothetical protein
MIDNLNKDDMKTNIKIKIMLTGLFGIIWSATLSGQSGSSPTDLCNLLKNNNIEAFNRLVTCFNENNKTGLQFSKNPGDGVAWLKGVEFSNGTIEIDIKGKDVLQQSFVGVAFHGVDEDTLDVIYFRPFNFRATDPVRKIHAVQYISHPDFPWQMLREKFNGKYEKAVDPSPDGNDWFHAKIVVEYPKVTVYVNGNAQPCLVVDKLNKRKTGKIGLWVGNNSDGDFASLRIINQK